MRKDDLQQEIERRQRDWSERGLASPEDELPVAAMIVERVHAGATKGDVQQILSVWREMLREHYRDLEAYD